MSMLAAALALLLPVATVAREPLRLEPSSKWHLDYAEGYCRLAREFGGAQGRKTVFYLEQYEPDNRFTVLVAGPGFAPEGIRDLAIRFGPGGAQAVAEQLRFVSANGYGTGVSMGRMGLLADASPPLAPPIPAGSTRYNPPARPSALTPDDAALITQFECLMASAF